MSLIDKILFVGENIQSYLNKHGMEETVKKYGLEKLLKHEILFQYEGTELYHDEYYAAPRVYNKQGKFLGSITHLMSPHYKKLGYFFGPCQNGNIILSQNNEKRQGKTYGVFDKSGNQIVEFNKYPEFCFLPNGIALMNESGEHNAVTVHIDGTVKTQPFLYFDTDSATGEYILYKRVGDDEVATYYATEKAVNDLTDSSTEIGTIEKGIE